MTSEALKKSVLHGELDPTFISECGISAEGLAAHRERVARAIERFEAHYGKDRDVSLYSVGGRSEISGNHTDHNHGRVIAASINLDIIAVAAKRDDGVIAVKSEGFPEDVVLPEANEAPDKSKFFTSASIIAGMERALLRKGYEVGGFDAYTTSNVLKGSGLSSSAAFEVMIGNILNHLYNEGKVTSVEIAKMAKFAENKFFGKPCGLMDQTACAVGGFITIDFNDPSVPKIKKMDFDLTEAGYALCIVNTGGNHADLNEDYASVPGEMRAVAAEFGQKVLRGLTVAQIIEKVPELREKFGDRAIMRAIHFIAENERVSWQVTALKEGDLPRFFEGVMESGRSSFEYLQNVYTSKNIREQGLSLALCLTEQFLAGKNGAWRVHGGGFAGTIQAFVPLKYAKDYSEYMDSIFGAGSCYTLSVRRGGAVKLA